jgi:hypothetical protein
MCGGSCGLEILDVSDLIGSVISGWKLTARLRAVPFFFGGNRYIDHRFIEALSRTTEWSNICRESGVVAAHATAELRSAWTGEGARPHTNRPYITCPHTRLGDL